MLAKKPLNSARLPFTQDPAPSDWVALAEAGAPIGLKGAVRLHTLKSVTGLPIDDSLLTDSDACWLKLPAGQWIHSQILECSVQTRGLKLQLADICDRNQAELLRGALIGLSRASFPELDEDEAYWADLIGCTIVNRQKTVIGQVESLQTNGEHDWLVTQGGMIPFVNQFVDDVDLAARRITVDWQPEWFE